jgi:hypothetical protein
MKKALLLFAALLVAGCGEKSSSEGSESASESAEPSADTAKPPPAESPVADSPSEEPSKSSKSLSDADLERLLEEAVDYDSFQERNGFLYQASESEPYSGWVKSMYDSGQVWGLGKFKDGKPDGPYTSWHENGQKEAEQTWKGGEKHGPFRVWHENGQKAAEGTMKDGELVSVKYWNSKGEEVETVEEATQE